MWDAHMMGIRGAKRILNLLIPVVRGVNQQCTMFVPRPETSSDVANPNKAVGLFGQASVSDASPNPVGWSVLGGISGTSPIPGRERDKFGIAAFYVGYAGGLKDGLRLAGLPARDETGMEVFYNFAVTPWLHVTADLQAVRPPRADRDTAFICGLRAQVLF